MRKSRSLNLLSEKGSGSANLGSTMRGIDPMDFTEVILFSSV